MTPQPAMAPPQHPAPETSPAKNDTAIPLPKKAPSVGDASGLPRAKKRSRTATFLGLGVVLAIAASGFTAWHLFGAGPAKRADLLTQRVGYERMKITVVERGTLESAENREIVCRVKAAVKGGTVASTIKWVIDDGTPVQKGDKLIELDDSALQDQLTTQQIAVEKAHFDCVNADEALKITRSQNASDIASAELALANALIDLEKWIKGDYEQQKRQYEGQVMTARSDLEMWEERASWSDRMSRPGRRYVTTSQAQSDAARKISAEIALEMQKENMRVLQDYTDKLNRNKLQGVVDEAKRALERVRLQAKAKENQNEADCKTKNSVHQHELDRLADVESEIQKCTIRAPDKGLVVYFVSEQSLFGQGSQQGIVAQGEPVREGQKLMRIPDMSQMVVNTKVHEAMMSRLRGEKWKRTGFNASVLSDSVLLGQTFHLNPWLNIGGVFGYGELRSDFYDQYKKMEQNLEAPGQRAKVRVDSYPDRILSGHVKTVAEVASQADRMASDVKVYQTMVSIDEALPGLKPGMSAEVTIETGEQASNVLAIPLQAIMGGVQLGPNRKCYVLTEHGPEERDIVVGLSNDKLAEITKGLAEGEEVVLNPRTLLNEKKKSQGLLGKNAPPESQGQDKKGKGPLPK